MSNFVRTTILLIGLTLLLVFFGEAVGGERGAVYAFFFACLMNFFAYWFSDKLVLAMYRAAPLAEPDAPEVYQIVRELAEKAGFLVVLMDLGG